MITLEHAYEKVIARSSAKPVAYGIGNTCYWFLAKGMGRGVWMVTKNDGKVAIENIMAMSSDGVYLDEIGGENVIKPISDLDNSRS